MWQFLAEAVGGAVVDWLAFDKHKSPWLKALQILAWIVLIGLVVFVFILLGSYFAGGGAE